MNIALLGNQARAMSNFWTVMIRKLLARGHTVTCIIPAPLPGEDPAWEDALRGLGVSIAHYPLDRKGLNPASDAKTLLALRAMFKTLRPDALFAYTIKPVIYGAFAAALAGFPRKNRRFVMITGLGYMFEGGSFARRLLLQVARALYRAAFQCAGTVFFQNEDDHRLFDKLSIIPSSVQVRLCRGTGVDVQHFVPKPTPSVSDAL
jgi:hypothetical protein